MNVCVFDHVKLKSGNIKYFKFFHFNKTTDFLSADEEDVVDYNDTLDDDKVYFSSDLMLMSHAVVHFRQSTNNFFLFSYNFSLQVFFS